MARYHITGVVIEKWSVRGEPDEYHEDTIWADVELDYSPSEMECKGFLKSKYNSYAYGNTPSWQSFYDIRVTGVQRSSY